MKQRKKEKKVTTLNNTRTQTGRPGSYWVPMLNLYLQETLHDSFTKVLNNEYKTSLNKLTLLFVIDVRGRFILRTTMVS